MIVAELIDITKEYPQPGAENARRVLDHLSLIVNQHETIAITGPSGSGKSTLLNMLGTLDKPTSGKVILGDQMVEAMPTGQLAAVRNRFIGFIFQQHLLLPQLTVLENVLLPMMAVEDKKHRLEASDRAMGLLQRVGLSNLSDQFPGRMSVGECQRAAVVRALINRPRLLLADEPTGSLDERNAAILAELLVELPSGEDCSLVMVTHDHDVAARMKTHYRLLNGKLIQNRP